MYLELIPQQLVSHLFLRVDCGADEGREDRQHACLVICLGGWKVYNRHISKWC